MEKRKKADKTLNSMLQWHREKIVKVLFGEDIPVEQIVKYFSWNPSRQRIYQILKKK